MADWDPPFPFDAKRIRQQDEKYWDDHGATPKAFVSLAAGRRLWGSRFGRTTSLRVAATEGLTLDALKQRLALDPAEMGFVFQPVKRQGLAASAGTTPFDVLFLAFSFFIIAAAVMLVALLFRLGIDHRAAQMGMLLAVGLRRRQIAALLAGEGLVAAARQPAGHAGGRRLCGADAAGAANLVAGGRRHAVSAAVRHAASLVIGYASGVVVALLAIVWAVLANAAHRPAATPGRRRRMRRLPQAAPRRAITPANWPPAMLDRCDRLGAVRRRIDQQEAQAGAFFGAGALVLIASLMLAWLRLTAGRPGRPWPSAAATSRGWPSAMPRGIPAAAR